MTDIAVLLYGYPGMYGFGRYGMYFMCSSLSVLFFRLLLLQK